MVHGVPRGPSLGPAHLAQLRAARHSGKSGKYHPYEEGEWEKFSIDIEDTYGALDLFRDNITEKIAWDKLEPGDMVSWNHGDGTGHSQTVTEAGDSWFLDFDDKNDFYTTVQGNQPKTVPYEKEYKFSDVQNKANEQVIPKRWNFKKFDAHK